MSNVQDVKNKSAKQATVKNLKPTGYQTPKVKKLSARGRDPRRKG